ELSIGDMHVCVHFERQRFNELVSEVITDASFGRLLCKDGYQAILDLATTDWCRSEAAMVALAVRKLGDFCDWSTFDRSRQLLDNGLREEDLRSELARIEQEREARLQESAEYQASFIELAKECKELYNDRLNFLKKMRAAENLMGFDGAAVKKI